MSVWIKEITASADDAEETDDGNNFNSTITDTSCHASTSASTRRNVGMRFAGCPVPKDASVARATIMFDRAKGGDANDDVDCTFFVEDVDDAADFSTTADVTSRATTGGGASWGVPDVGDVEIESTNLAGICTTHFARSGWAANNAFVMLMKGDNAATNHKLSFHSADDATDPGPILTMVYDAGGTVAVDATSQGTVASASSDFDITAPTGSGGLLIVSLFYNSQTANVITAANAGTDDWTEIAETNSATGSIVTLAVKDAGSTDMTFQRSVSVEVVWVCYRVSGYDDSAAMDMLVDAAGSLDTDVSAPFEVSPPDSTRIFPAGALGLIFVGHTLDTAWSTSAFTGYTRDVSETGGVNASLDSVAVFSKSLTANGTHVTPTGTTPGSGSSLVMTVTVEPGVDSSVPTTGHQPAAIAGTSTTAKTAEPVGRLAGAATGTAAAVTKTAAPNARGAATTVGRVTAAKTSTPPNARGGAVAVGRATTTTWLNTPTLGGRLGGLVVGRAVTVPSRPGHGVGAIVGRVKTSPGKPTAAAAAAFVAGTSGPTPTAHTYPGRIKTLVVGKATTTATRTAAARGAAAVHVPRAVSVYGTLIWGVASPLVVGRATTAKVETTTGRAVAFAAGLLQITTSRTTLASRAAAAAIGHTATPAPSKPTQARTVALGAGRVAAAHRREHPAYGGGLVVGRATTSCVRTSRARGGAVALGYTPGSFTSSRNAAARGAALAALRVAVSTGRNSPGGRHVALHAARALSTTGTLGAPDVHPVQVTYRDPTTAVLVRDPTASVTVTETAGVVYAEGG